MRKIGTKTIPTGQMVGRYSVMLDDDNVEHLVGIRRYQSGYDPKLIYGNTVIEFEGSYYVVKPFRVGDSHCFLKNLRLGECPVTLIQGPVYAFQGMVNVYKATDTMLGVWDDSRYPTTIESYESVTVVLDLEKIDIGE